MLVNRKGEDDFVKVLDFGISKDLDCRSGEHGAALTRPDVAIGTPVYMAPEQAAGRPANALTDVYAVGGLLYEMLTGVPALRGRRTRSTCCTRRRTRIRWRSRRCGRICRARWNVWSRARSSRAPRDRHASMTAMKEHVLACLGVVERGVDRAHARSAAAARATQMRSSSTEPVPGRPAARARS